MKFESKRSNWKVDWNWKVNNEIGKLTMKLESKQTKRQRLESSRYRMDQSWDFTDFLDSQLQSNILRHTENYFM